MKRPAVRRLTLTVACGLALAGGALASSGHDTRSCYRYSDSLPPLDQDAPTGDFVDIAQTGAIVSVGPDAVSSPISIGFTFEFFGKRYTQVMVSSNGTLQFVPNDDAGSAVAQHLPDGVPPSGLIAGLWDLLAPGPGSIRYQLLGSAPNRSFVVQFTNVPERATGGSGDAGKWQVVLLQGSNEIVARYVGVSNGQYDAVAGVEDATGSFGLTWKFGKDPFGTAAVRYIPVHTDTDGDGVDDCIDTCRRVFDPSQADADGDGTGDACDLNGPEFTVGPTSADATPAVADDATGHAIVVWEDDQKPVAIRGRRYDAAGASLGGPFPVSTVAADQRAPRVSSTQNGFVVAWLSSLPGIRVVARPFTAGGDPLRGVIDVAPGAIEAADPGVATAFDGSFVVVWGNDAGGISMGRFDAAGQPVDGAPIPVSQIVASGRPDVVADPSGDLLVAWLQCCGPNLESRGRRFHAGGSPIEDEHELGEIASDSSQRGPRAASLGMGDFVVTWVDVGPASSTTARIRRIRGGQMLTDEPELPLLPEGAVDNAEVAADALGSFIVVWEDAGHVRGQRFHRDGRRQGPTFPLAVTDDAGGLDGSPAVAQSQNGDAILVWRRQTEVAPASVVFEVVGRRLARCGNGNVDPGEECDDGNRLDGDCCSSLCTFDLDGAACTSASPCIESMTCSEGVCGGGRAVTCDDGVACTVDRCDPSVGCVASPQDGACDDGNSCTIDRCDRVAGCSHTPADGGACDDRDACTTADVCSGGACVGQSIACDDGNPCTSNACDPVVGCTFPPADGIACDDDDACTDGDVCAAAACAGTRVCGFPLAAGSEVGAKKMTVKIDCLAAPGSTCAAELLVGVRTVTAQPAARAGKPGPAPEGYVRITKAPKLVKVRKGRVTIKLQLTRRGQSMLANVGSEGLLPVLGRATIATRGQSPRVALLPLMLRAPAARRAR